MQERVGGGIEYYQELFENINGLSIDKHGVHINYVIGLLPLNCVELILILICLFDL